MIRISVPAALFSLGSVAGLALWAVAASGDDRAPKRRPDRTKEDIERPAKQVLAKASAEVPAQINTVGAANPTASPKDMTKGVIVRPAKAVLAGASAGASAAAPDFVNPKVQAGKVKWHADFATACAASARSKKPVLLFHLMGRLDQQFC
jgi:hypothetical protein